MQTKMSKNKKRVLILLVIIPIITLIIVIQKTEERQIPSEEKEVVEKEMPVMESDQVDSQLHEAITPSQSTIDEYVEERQRKFEQRHQWEMQQDVNFVFEGQLIDQDGVSIQGVEVLCVITRYNEDFLEAVLAKDRTAKRKIKNELKVFSDSNGIFRIEGHGRRIVLESFEKEGYEEKYEDRHFYFWKDNTSIGKDKPRRYVMWRKQIGPTVEPNDLIISKLSSKLLVDGRPYSYDFLLRKRSGKTINGDVVVTFLRDADADATHYSQYDWSFKIEAIDGGIQETADTFLYRAPKDGYLNSYTFEMKQDSSEWSNRIKRKKFYVKSRDGSIYTALEIEVRSYYQDGAWMALEWVTNDQGSTNLEITNTR